MKTVLLTGLILISLRSFGQGSDSWKILFNNQEIVYSNLSNEPRHTRSISKAEIKKTGFLEVLYFTHNSHFNWFKCMTKIITRFTPLLLIILHGCPIVF